MNALEVTPAAGPVSILKSLVTTGAAPDDEQKQVLLGFLDSLESKLPTAVALPSQPDITNNSAQGPPEDRLLRMKEVEKMVNYSRRTISVMVEAGVFPPPIRMNSRCHRWRLSSIQEYIAELEAA